MREKLERSGGFLGMGGIATMAFLYFALPFADVPTWAAVVLCAVWVVHFVLGCRWFEKKPLQALLLPLSLFAIWALSLYAGQEFLNWGA